MDLYTPGGAAGEAMRAVVSTGCSLGMGFLQRLGEVDATGAEALASCLVLDHTIVAPHLPAAIDLAWGGREAWDPSNP